MYKYLGSESLYEVFISNTGEKYVLVEEMDYCVYFISDGEYTKVGVAASLPNRMKQLQTGNPRKLRALFVVNAISQSDAYKIEKKLHKAFDSKRQVGEWFKLREYNIRAACAKLGIVLLKPVSKFDFEVDGISIVQEKKIFRLTNSE